jgi:hypothetical protein
MIVTKFMQRLETQDNILPSYSGKAKARKAELSS